jgi:hypothetical protein
MATDSPTQSADETAFRLHAVIIAAVSAVIEQEFRITSIADVHIDPRWSTWSSEGRRDIFSSHRFR